MQLPVFRRTLSHLFLELLVEVVHVPVAHPRRDLVDAQLRFFEKLAGFGDPDLVQVIVEVLSGPLLEQLSEIRAVVAEQRRDVFELQGLGVQFPSYDIPKVSRTTTPSGVMAKLATSV